MRYKVRPKDSFLDMLSNGYIYTFNSDFIYGCRKENGMYYVTDEFDYEVPFDESDFKETFEIVE
jgi:hypothetical protein